MAEEKGRVIDRDFEQKVKARLSNIKREAKRDLVTAEKYVETGKYRFEEAVLEHPYAFVFGAFVGG